MAGLYVHIPFCRSKCAYCDFYSGPLRSFDEAKYAEALLLELSARRREVDEFHTAYIGGGTPSSLHPEVFAPFLALADGERTVEVNPEDITDDYARGLRDVGVNRVSMGVQSLVDGELAAIGRRHDAARAVRAFEILRKAGFDNISLDLMYGLPGQTLESWEKSLHGVLALGPEHLSAYILSYEPGTLLHTRLVAGKIREADDALIGQMYAALCDAASDAGFSHYEISNFARPGFEAQHNSAYWTMTPYLGLGPGAHSFDGSVRRANVASLRDYMMCPTGAFEVEEETENERHNDVVMTALRTSRGLDAGVLSAAELKIAEKVLERTAEGRLRIGEKDWLRSNSIMELFIRV